MPQIAHTSATAPQRERGDGLVSFIFKRDSESGNMAIIIMVAFTLLFAFGAFAIDAGLYMKRRDQMQALAESVAMAAAQELPWRGTATSHTAGTGAIGAALRWYETLRTEPNGTVIAPAANCPSFSPTLSTTGTYLNCAGASANQGIEISFNDRNTASDIPLSATEPYKVYAIQVSINDLYQPEFFPIRDQTIASINVLGKASIQPAATDVIMIVENSASFIDNDDSTVVDAANFTSAFGATLARKYEQQCFSEPWKNFKRGVIELYDRLSQLETYRVGVLLMNSRSGSAPFVLANPGTTKTYFGALDTTMWGVDDSSYSATRCIEMTRAAGANYPVPTNINSSTWTTARTDLTALYDGSANPAGGVYSVDNNSEILVREALWITPAGFSTKAGFIPPRYYQQSPQTAIDLAKNLLKDSRRSDNLPVQHRVIIILTDDAGYTSSEVKNPQYPSAAVSSQNPCQYWYTNAANDSFESQIRLGVVYFGHYMDNTSTTKFITGHKYSDTALGTPIADMRAWCLKGEDSSRLGMFFVENSPTFEFDLGNTNKTTTHRADIYADFYTHTTPIVAQALKELEFRKQ